MSKKKRTRFPWGRLGYPVGSRKNVYLVQGSGGLVSLKADRSSIPWCSASKSDLVVARSGHKGIFKRKIHTVQSTSRLVM